MIYKTNNCHLFTFTTLLVLLPLCQSRAVSGINRSIRMIRDVYPELITEKPNGGNQVQVCIFGDVVYGSGETVASSNPCERCECRPPGVVCNPVTCAVPQPGCRVLLRPDQCCPQYQCECTHAGRTYANGERVNNASKGPCLVCYCRGGLIQCATIGCYKRDDCEPVHVPGQCCPKYDHCPPRDNILDNPHSLIDRQSTLPNITNNDSENDQLSAENILIKNISQSGESELEESSGNGEVDEKITEDFLDALSIKKENKEQDSSEHHKISVEKNPNSLATFVKDSGIRSDEESFQSGISDISFPQITIKEILPERTENPVVAPPKREINFEHNSSSEESNSGSSIESINLDQKTDSQENKEVVLKFGNPLEQFEEVSTNDTNLDASNEVETENVNKDTTDFNEAYSPVLRVGDQLLIFKQGALVPGNDVDTSSPIITVIGAEGLQPGTAESEDSEEHGDIGLEQADEQAPVSNETADSNISIPAVLSKESNYPIDYLLLDSREKTNSNDASFNSQVPTDIQNDFDSASIDVSSGFGPDSVPINIDEATFDESSIADISKKDISLNSDISSDEKLQINLYNSQSTQASTDSGENDLTTEESRHNILEINSDTANSSSEVNETNVKNKELEINESFQDSSNKHTTEKSSLETESNDQLNDDHIDASLEYNPEYPPLPEDLGISDRLEDTTYTDFFENSQKSNLKNSTNQETENQTSSTDVTEVISSSTESQENVLNIKAELPASLLNKHTSSDDYVNDEESSSMLKKNVKDIPDIETVNEPDLMKSDELSTVTTLTTIDSINIETENSTSFIENTGQTELANDDNNTVTVSPNIEPKKINKESDLIAKDNFDIIAESSFIHEDKMMSDSSKDSNYRGNTVVKKNLSGTGNNMYKIKDTNSSENYKIIERSDPTDMEMTAPNSVESVEVSTDSGEHMTEKNQHDSLLSSEDASIEIIQDNSSDIKDDFEMVLPLVEDVIETKNYGIDPIDTVLNHKSSEKNLEDVEFIQINCTQQEFVHSSNKTHESSKMDESTEKNHKNEVNSEPDTDISTESIKVEAEPSTQDGMVLTNDDISKLKQQDNFGGSVVSAIRDFFQNQYRETK